MFNIAKWNIICELALETHFRYPSSVRMAEIADPFARPSHGDVGLCCLFPSASSAGRGCGARAHKIPKS